MSADFETPVVVVDPTSDIGVRTYYSTDHDERTPITVATSKGGVHWTRVNDIHRESIKDATNCP